MRRAVSTVLAAVMVVAVAAAGCAGGSDGPELPVRTVAFLRAVPGTATVERAMLDELRDAGLVRGRNLRVLAGDPGQVHADPDEARAVVAEWRDDGVDLIVAPSTAGAELARQVAPEVDVLFVSNDPVAAGFVEDESAPGGRLTGLAYRVPADRLLDVARRLLPDLGTVGLAHPAADPAAIANRDAYADAADVVAVSTSPAALMALEETSAAAAALVLPVIAMTPQAFALVTLSPESDEVGRQLGRQAARLLTGADAADVPVEVPRRFVLTVNGAVAERFGIPIPDDVLVEAQVVLP